VIDTDAPEIDPDYYLRERYARQRRRPLLLAAYYALKPLMPRATRLALRRVYARRQAARRFPGWPIETILVDHQRAEFRRRIHAGDGKPIDFINFWPDCARFAAVLTHDVEGTTGIENIPRLREIERRHGFVSAWYFVAEEYPIPPGLFDALRAEGCEVGLHGIRHDAKLFFNRRSFETELPTIHRYLADWQVVGFRSPATHRNADWMPELGCLYDTSFSDTAPFEPQPGGCCSIQPYFLDDLVELPMTLTMDHTLWEVLGMTASPHWAAKAQWVIANHGLINLLVHPDYATSEQRLACYDEFLAFLASQEGAWHALPRQVATWWKLRASLDVDTLMEQPVTMNGATGRPTVAYAREFGGEIVFDCSDASRT
jgi:peptidoglycan/xylan/chitin deacetylase (PgdA/CDA1 family)